MNYLTREFMKATLRGFIYQDLQGAWVLSDEPNLKSCCINSAGKAERQILLSGDFHPTDRAVTLTGNLKVVEGRIHLSDAQKEQGSSGSAGWIGLLIACGAILMVWMWRKRNLFHFPS